MDGFPQVRERELFLSQAAAERHASVWMEHALTQGGVPSYTVHRAKARGGDKRLSLGYAVALSLDGSYIFHLSIED